MDKPVTCLIFINRICQKPVDSCFCRCLSDVSVKNTEAVTQKSSVKRCSKELPKIYRKLQAGASIFIKKTPTRAYFRHLLRAVPAHNALFQFLWEFSHSRNLELACCLGEFNL